jgi:hypothetical protein
VTAVAGDLRRDGRLAGVLYLLVVLAGIHGLAYVPAQTGETLGQVSAHAGLFRTGIASLLVMQVAFLLLPFALHRVLGDIDASAATAMVALAVASVPVGLVAVTHRMEALAVLDAAASGATDAMEAAFASCLQRYRDGLRVASLFWGLWLLPFGWLVVRSRRMPRVLGLLLVLGGLGYVAQVFGGLVPGIADADWLARLRLPAAFGEIGSCLWLLLFGAGPGRHRPTPASPA